MVPLGALSSTLRLLGSSAWRFDLDFCLGLAAKRRHGNENVSGTQLQERTLGILRDFLLGILRFRIIKLPCRNAEFLKPGLVGDLVGLAVVDNLCHFFTCHHIIVVLTTKIGRLLQVSMTWLTGWLPVTASPLTMTSACWASAAWIRAILYKSGV